MLTAAAAVLVGQMVGLAHVAERARVEITAAGMVMGVVYVERVANLLYE